MQNGAAIPIGNLGLGPGLTDAMDSRQQQVVGRRRAGSRRGPKGFQYSKDSGLLCREPKRAGQAEVARGGGKRNWRSAVLDQSSDFIGGAEIRLVDDARLAIDAGAFDDVVVELVALLLGDERGHIG